MLDNRIYTFLELCGVMNYHKTAENLKMTQPAVTQHIKFLEDEYNCKLFNYSNRKLQKTEKGIELEKYARNIVSLNLSAKEELIKKEKVIINIGATKTIAEYTMNSVILSLISSKEYEANFIIDNTKNLIKKLNHFELDLLLLEGDVDKEKYLYKKISEQEIIGICSLSHEFAFKEVNFEDILNQKIVIRENGSGTRDVFNKFLQNNGYSYNSFENKSIVSSNKIIENLVENNIAISFVYDVIQNQNNNLAYFRIKGKKVFHDFNFVYFNNPKALKIIDLITKELNK